MSHFYHICPPTSSHFMHRPPLLVAPACSYNRSEFKSVLTAKQNQYMMYITHKLIQNAHFWELKFKL